MSLRDGELIVAPDLRLQPNTSEATFLSTSVGKSATVMVSNGPYVTYRAGSVQADSRQFTVVAGFAHGLISSVQLHEISERGSEGWASYSLESTAATERRNDRWLHRELGSPGPWKFDWGQIESVMDLKGAMTFVCLTFRR